MNTSTENNSVDNMGRKKICFIVARPGVATGFLREPINKLATEFDVYLASNFEGKPMELDLPLAGCFDFPIERNPGLWNELKALRLLYRYFRKERFFAVHSQALNASLLTSIAGWMARVPHRIRIFTGQMWVTMTGFRRKFYRFLDRVTIALNTELLVDGKPQRQFLIDEGILKDGQAEVLAKGSISGVDVNRFCPTELDRDTERNNLGIKPEQVVFTFLGRLKRDKGLFEILTAFNQLAMSEANAFLLLFGNDEEDVISHLPEYKNICEGKNFCYFGPTRKPEKSLQAADVFLLPSYREGFGVSAIEAACLGLPVICSDTYGMADTMIDNVTGLRCAVGDAKSLYESMLRLYNDTKLRLKMGKEGRNRVLRDFSSEYVSNEWLRFYKNLK